MKKIAVLVSSTGSTLQHFLENGLSIRAVIADRECDAIGIAQAAGIDVVLMTRTFDASFDRDDYTRQLAGTLCAQDIDLVAMAGWKTVFSPLIFRMYEKRILNTHPSLLPKFKGAHAVRDALRAGVRITGCTVHYAEPELDAGPIIEQAFVRIEDGDTESTLHERIQSVEKPLYLGVIRRMARGR
ncbi:MAG: phosphoribosylglycinamide formyltransferase [Minisyncoccia bacterium]